ncbi:hypothetical protein GE300_19610 [Rhodobacteraceae bacterium 2CG4]|uniref:Flagellar hook-length control protein-like C-terminal domain-containing protein n=1 Tax=Halovulum marinum TaxID=2662447 RepID=A0A6L5Z5S7_9RHOB|nr:flagellar hook-length control protein FliK [Halovulum marinum]MSU91787.1 hypothetical protein [Halovulum marinum]
MTHGPELIRAATVPTRAGKIPKDAAIADKDVAQTPRFELAAAPEVATAALAPAGRPAQVAAVAPLPRQVQGLFEPESAATGDAASVPAQVRPPEGEAVPAFGNMPPTDSISLPATAAAKPPGAAPGEPAVPAPARPSPPPTAAAPDAEGRRWQPALPAATGAPAEAGAVAEADPEARNSARAPAPSPDAHQEPDRGNRNHQSAPAVAKPAPATGAAHSQAVADATAPIGGESAAAASEPQTQTQASAAPRGPGLSAVPTAPQEDHVQSLIARIATRSTAGGERELQLRLDPPELGSVRITLSGSDGHLTAVVSADRADVEQLLRRHAQDLAGALSDAGYEGVDIDFGTGHDSAEDALPEHMIAAADILGDAETRDTGAAGAAAARPSPALADGRLDIRL